MTKKKTTAGKKNSTNTAKKTAVMKYFIIFSSILASLSALAFLVLYIYISSLFEDLPKFERLAKYEPNLITRTYSADGVLIKEFFTENRSPVNLDSIPEHVVHALISTEDREFYNHWGFNSRRTAYNAFMAVPRKFRGQNIQGASTITQQLARNLYDEVGFKKDLERKLRELLTSVQLERMYSKNEILEMYLMQCMFAEGTYGIQSASRRVFGKSSYDLKIEEGALLIAQLKAPAHYSPFRRPERGIARRNLVLYNMYQMDFLSRAEYDSLRNIPLAVAEPHRADDGIAPYFTEHVRQKLRDNRTAWGVNYLRDGLTVHTTIDTRIQAVADSMVKKHVEILNRETRNRFVRDRSWGLRKYVRDNYDSTRWEFKMKDTEMLDSLVNEKLKPQVALIAMNPSDGNILAMVGGTDFSQFKFNTALQAWRQPGSIFKPIVYLAAIDNGYSPATKLINQPVVVMMPDGSRWQPSNYDTENIGGYISLREALTHSLNLISVRLIMELVNPREVVSYARKVGINTRHLLAVNSIALGSGAMRPIDILTAYSTLANKGTRIDPLDILRVEDKNGNLIEQNFPVRTGAVSPESAYLITSMMEDVVNSGTGRRLRWQNNFRHPVAGKTGTTNDFTDAWFCGYTPKIAVVVWVGLPDQRFKLGHGATGSNTALPLWGDFIAEVYRKMRWQGEPFEIPEGILQLDICTESMERAGPYCPRTTKEYFNERYLPASECEIHTPRSIRMDGRGGRF